MGEPERIDPSIFKVMAFKEKPTAAMAADLLKSGRWVWNSGIFLLPAQRLCEEFGRLEPGLFRACKAAVETAEKDGEYFHLAPEAFSCLPSISIDHAIMERTDKAYVLRTNFRWHDVGTWAALWQLGSKGEDGTVALGQTIMRDVRDCYIRSEGPVVAALGVQDLIIVATKVAILVMDRNRSQELRLLLDEGIMARDDL